MSNLFVQDDFVLGFVIYVEIMFSSSWNILRENYA